MSERVGRRIDSDCIIYRNRIEGVATSSPDKAEQKYYFDEKTQAWKQLKSGTSQDKSYPQRTWDANKVRHY